jgi:hypothetical protein
MHFLYYLLCFLLSEIEILTPGPIIGKIQPKLFFYQPRVTAPPFCQTRVTFQINYQTCMFPMTLWSFATKISVVNTGKSFITWTSFPSSNAMSTLKNGILCFVMKESPAGNVVGQPAKQVNDKALIVNHDALLTDDSPNCQSVDRMRSISKPTHREVKSLRLTRVR